MSFVSQNPQRSVSFAVVASCVGKIRQSCYVKIRNVNVIAINLLPVIMRCRFECVTVNSDLLLQCGGDIVYMRREDKYFCPNLKFIWPSVGQTDWDGRNTLSRNTNPIESRIIKKFTPHSKGIGVVHPVALIRLLSRPPRACETPDLRRHVPMSITSQQMFPATYCDKVSKYKQMMYKNEVYRSIIR